MLIGCLRTVKFESEWLPPTSSRKYLAEATTSFFLRGRPPRASYKTIFKSPLLSLTMARNEFVFFQWRLSALVSGAACAWDCENKFQTYFQLQVFYRSKNVTRSVTGGCLRSVGPNQCAAIAQECYRMYLATLRCVAQKFWS